jgi:PKD repeat protein
VKPRPHLAAALLALSAAALAAQPPSHERNPTVVFPGPGNYDVTLTVCNASGCSETTKTITVLDPVPKIQSALAQPTPVPIGQVVTLLAKATGKPPIGFHWTITSPSGSTTLLDGNPASWPTARLVPGAYPVDLRSDSPSGVATTAVGTVVLIPDTPARFWALHKPCRLLDTRSTTAPLLSTDPPRVFPIASNPACPIPATAVAIAANVTAISPSGPGFFTLFPGNYYPPTTSTLSLNPRYTARSAFAVIPISTDGRATIAARFGSDRQASAHLVLDVTGYFLPAHPPAPVALRFDSPLCPAFCIFPADIPLALHYQVLGSPSVYRYDWTGSGSFTQTSSTPLSSYTFASPGYYEPRLQVAASGSTASTVGFTPAILTTSPVPAAAPPAPSGVRASFLGVVPADPLDPRETAPVPTFALTVASPPGGALLPTDEPAPRSSPFFTPPSSGLGCRPPFRKDRAHRDQLGCPEPAFGRGLTELPGHFTNRRLSILRPRPGGSSRREALKGSPCQNQRNHLRISSRGP